MAGQGLENSSNNKAFYIKLFPPLHRLHVCSLTELSCKDLLSVLTSSTTQLQVLDMNYNQIRDQGFIKMCTALRSPHCKLRELQYVYCFFQLCVFVFTEVTFRF